MKEAGRVLAAASGVVTAPPKSSLSARATSSKSPKSATKIRVRTTSSRLPPASIKAVPMISKARRAWVEGPSARSHQGCCRRSPRRRLDRPRGPPVSTQMSLPKGSRMRSLSASKPSSVPLTRVVPSQAHRSAGGQATAAERSAWRSPSRFRRWSGMRPSTGFCRSPSSARIRSSARRRGSPRFTEATCMASS